MEKAWGAITKLFETPVQLLIAMGFLVLVLGCSGGVHYHEYFPITEPIARAALVSVGVLSLGGGFFVHHRQSLDAPKIEGIKAEITSPENGVISEKVDVFGSISGEIPNGYHVYVCRFYKDSSFIPLRKVRMDGANGKWDAHDCWVGGDKPGDKRWLAVCLVSEDVEFFLNYWSKATNLHQSTIDSAREKLGNTFSAKPLPSIPVPKRGFKELHRIMVIRK